MPDQDFFIIVPVYNDELRYVRYLKLVLGLNESRGLPMNGSEGVLP